MFIWHDIFVIISIIFIWPWCIYHTLLVKTLNGTFICNTEAPIFKKSIKNNILSTRYLIIFLLIPDNYINNFNNLITRDKINFHQPCYEIACVRTFTLKLVCIFAFMNIVNKTEAAVFSCRLCFLRAFPFISFLLLNTMY